MKGRHVAKAMDFSREELDKLIKVAHKLHDIDNCSNITTDNTTANASITTIPPFLQGKVMSLLFFENSSRTFCSFMSAMQKLGGGVVNLPIEHSSASKGESLEDTIRTVAASTDVIVIRHPDSAAMEMGMKVVKDHRHAPPIVNAGNGSGEHPTQAILDLFTIDCELGGIDGLTIVLLGDLKHGRTAHSLAKILTKYKNIKLHLVAPEALKMPESVVTFVKEENARNGGGVISVQEHSTITSDIISQANVLYVTRVQSERFPTADAYEAVKGSYCIDAKAMEAAKPQGSMIVMHPLPRNDELATDVDSDPRAAYFRQMRCALYARMALLLAVFGVEDRVISPKIL